MTQTVVLYPSPGIGHLIAMVELGKLILNHRPSFSVVVLITNTHFDDGGATAPYISRVSATVPSISFHQLPFVALPRNVITFVEDIFFEVSRLNIPAVRDALLSISNTSKLTAFILDFFCYASVQVLVGLNVPTYYFFTSGASVLALFLYLPVVHERITQNIKDADVFVDVPGTPPIHTLDFPDIIYWRDSRCYTHLLNVAISMAKSSGILVNTFRMLEPRADRALSNGECVPRGSSSPPVYHIGPLIMSGDDESHEDDKPECLKWLDGQPERSVVFLCFGSRGMLKLEQLKEMAVGIEKSGQRFLWAVRRPQAEDGRKPDLERDVESLLPEGFLERTKERGFVVKEWAPQLAVLRHPSVGGFVSHCGWNSSLEAVTCGVPMVAWPLYAEQRMNKRYLVEEFKVALPVEFSPEGFVTAAALEKAIRGLMESESGKGARERIKAMKEEAKVAMEDGGSSSVTLVRLLDSWK